MFINRPPLVYSLGFSTGEEDETAVDLHPQLLIKVPKNYQEWLPEVFASSWFGNILEASSGYLKNRTRFQHWEPGIASFGFGDNAVTETEGEYVFHFPLVAERADEVALSLHHLCKALFYILADDSDDAQQALLSCGREQMLRIETSCGYTIAGHSINLELYAPCTERLDQGAKTYAAGGSYILPEATKRLQVVLKSLHPSTGQREIDECEVQLWSDGRFLVQIPNRVGLYVSQASRTHDWPMIAGSGNTDGPKQQLALIAGFTGLLDWLHGLPAPSV